MVAAQNECLHAACGGQRKPRFTAEVIQTTTHDGENETQFMIMKSEGEPIVITAGSNYLDIDAYACCAAMQELLALQGIRAVAYSAAPGNYSVCKSLLAEGQIAKKLPPDFPAEASDYIIVDVSDPDYIRDAVPLERVCAVYDHHTGFEAYWERRIGENAHIEFLGAAATLIFREWKGAGLVERMTRPTALLLIAAILDNTLDMTSANTTPEDREAFETLCALANVDAAWCAAYFSEVQYCVEADLENALLKDLKKIPDHAVLPPRVAQLCVWDAARILKKLDAVRQILGRDPGTWMLNIIDISRRRSWFVCDDPRCQTELERIFDVRFAGGTAKCERSYLRKEILKKVQEQEGRA